MTYRQLPNYTTLPTNSGTSVKFCSSNKFAVTKQRVRGATLEPAAQALQRPCSVELSATRSKYTLFTWETCQLWECVCKQKLWQSGHRVKPVVFNCHCSSGGWTVRFTQRLPSSTPTVRVDTKTNKPDFLGFSCESFKVGFGCSKTNRIVLLVTLTYTPTVKEPTDWPLCFLEQ